MRSGWFFGTDMWAEYLQEYAKTRPECLSEWRSSPLVNDHDFSEALAGSDQDWTVEQRKSQVLTTINHDMSQVRSSYRSIINKGNDEHDYIYLHGISVFKDLHRQAFGNVRTDKTFDIQHEWIRNGNAAVVAACDGSGQSGTIGKCPKVFRAAVLWIIYDGKAYFASAPSIRRNVMHGLVQYCLESILPDFHEVTVADMGQIDGSEAATRGIFKTGFGGEAKPFMIVRRV